MRVRYRKLTSHFDDQAFQDLQRDGKLSRGTVAAEEIPREVTAEDGEAEDWEVEAMLVRGTLGPGDLVNFGKSWEALSESARYSEVCELQESRKRRRRLLTWSAVVLAGLAAAVVVTLAR